MKNILIIVFIYLHTDSIYENKCKGFSELTYSDTTINFNIPIGMNSLMDTIKIKTCKHGADWNHPKCKP